MRPGMAILIAAAWILASTPGVPAEVYTWVDADGGRHYADRLSTGHDAGGRVVSISPSATVDRVQPELPDPGLPVKPDRPAPSSGPTEGAATRPDPEAMSCSRR